MSSVWIFVHSARSFMVRVQKIFFEKPSDINQIEI